MEIALARELAQLINDKVATGKYILANEVIGEALRLLQERDHLLNLIQKQSFGPYPTSIWRTCLLTPDIKFALLIHFSSR